MRTPLVSIIIPTYNRGHLLGETLESIMAQTYQNWECIIVDDGSTDNTLEVVQCFTNIDRRFQYHQRPEDHPKGAGACRNYGFGKCKGEFVQFFDSDDLMESNLLSRKLTLLLSNNHYDYCLSGMSTFENIHNRKKIISNFPIKVNTLFEDYILGKVYIGTPIPLWKRSVLEPLEVIFNEELTQSQDLDLHTRIFNSNTNYCIINEPLILIRKGGDSISSGYYNDSKSHIDSFLYVRKNILKLRPNNEIILNRIISTVFNAFRTFLQRKEYVTCDKCLVFLNDLKFKKNFRFKLILYRVIFIYYFVRIFGKGTYFFKKYLVYK